MFDSELKKLKMINNVVFFFFFFGISFADPIVWYFYKY